MEGINKKEKKKERKKGRGEEEKKSIKKYNDVSPKITWHDQVYVRIVFPAYETAALSQFLLIDAVHEIAMKIEINMTIENDSMLKLRVNLVLLKVMRSSRSLRDQRC